MEVRMYACPTVEGVIEQPDMLLYRVLHREMQAKGGTGKLRISTESINLFERMTN